MKRRPVLAALAAAPLVVWAQSQSTVIIDSTTATPAPAKVAPKKAYVPHKTPDAPKASNAPRKPAAPKAPKPPDAPKKPSNVPAVIYDQKGNAIPTSPDAYDVSSATKKK